MDSANAQYARLEKAIGKFVEPSILGGQLYIEDFQIDSATGGLAQLTYLGKNMLTAQTTEKTFAPIYSLGIKPQTIISQPKLISVEPVRDNSNVKEVIVSMVLADALKMEIRYTLDKGTRLLYVNYKVNKNAVKDKEAMHIALPFFGNTKDILYGSSSNLLSLKNDQMAGSNREFICTDKELVVKTAGPTFHLHSPQINLFEVGGIINEEQVNGAKVWEKELGDLSQLYLYVFNNYWHTNYKAYQQGNFEFELILGLE